MVEYILTVDGSMADRMMATKSHLGSLKLEPSSRKALDELSVDLMWSKQYKDSLPVDSATDPNKERTRIKLIA